MRALWLIDGSYIYKAMRDYQRINPQYNNKGVDYKKLKDKLKYTYDIETMDSYYFNSTPDPTNDVQNPYHRWLKSAEPQGPNIRVKLYGIKKKTYNCRNCNTYFTVTMQKGVDVGIATTALRLHERYDAIFLSAGDGDFFDFVRYIVEDKDKQLYIVGFNGSISLDIQQFCTNVFLLNDHYADVCDDRQPRPFDTVDEVTDEIAVDEV
jgi:uncharacterized LabA/DUF88 family protein